MPYMHMLSDTGMNYTLDRPLLDGTSAARITEIGAVAPQIKDYESWHAVWLGLAKRAEAESGGSMPPRTTTARSSILRRRGSATGFMTTSRELASWNEGCRRVRTHRDSLPRRPLAGISSADEGKELRTFIFHGGYDLLRRRVLWFRCL